MDTDQPCWHCHTQNMKLNSCTNTQTDILSRAQARPWHAAHVAGKIPSSAERNTHTHTHTALCCRFPVTQTARFINTLESANEKLQVSSLTAKENIARHIQCKFIHLL